MDTQQSRNVVLEDTPSDIVTPPVLPVQMPATQTSPTVSHDHAAMRDPDEMIPWDDLDDVPVAILPVGFRMPDIERYTGVGCPRIHLRLYSTRWYASLESSRRRTWEDLAQEFLRQYSFSGDTSVTRRELESLRQGSDESVSSFISRWRERAAEMIERPAERYQMSIGLWSDIIPSPDTEGKRVGGSSEGYGDICSADFQHRRPGYHSYARSLQIPRSDFPPLQHRHPHPVQLYPSTHPHAVTVQPSFQFQRPQTGIPRHEQSRPHRRHQRTYSDLGMPLDRAFERLRSTGVLVPLAPRPLPSTLPPRFRAHEFCAFHQMAGHRTDYCASLRHTIQDLIDSGAFRLPRAYTVMFETPRALIFTRRFDIAYLVEHIEIRLLQLRFTMSDEIAPITLTALYEMMVDLTRRVERIELILSGHPSSSRGAPGVAMHSLPHLTSSTPVTLGASHPRPRPHSVFQQHSSSISLATPTRPPLQFPGPPVVTVPQDRFPPHRRCRRHFSDLSAPLSKVFETFQAMGFLAPLAPRTLPDPVPPQFRLDLYCAYHQSVGHHTDRCTALRHAIQDIVDSGTFGHPQSDMSLISTQLRPCMQTPLHQQSLILLIWAIDS
ncbi:hypothetical protein CK203_065587 [Vitis vinifera]|uniref:Retrotransposon gag domain-containing protein n=1 Tax=Vitis vinifera TaxID=29760 RepID=A0A438FPJ1_VITVI|nr:hypothetical protein CK203_065587 [Vitis vinifera]